MKGILQASAFYLMLMGISAGFMLLISLEHMRQTSITNLKQAIEETAHLLADEKISDRESQVQSILTEAFQVRKPANEIYEIEVLGFNSDPLLIRVALTVTPLYLNETWHYRYEESLIEVNS